MIPPDRFRRAVVGGVVIAVATACVGTPATDTGGGDGVVRQTTEPSGSSPTAGSPATTTPPDGGLAWERLEALPTRRTEVTAASDGRRIAVIGGLAATPEGSSGTVASLDVLELASGTWSDGPDLPIAVNHAMATGAGGDIYVLGGYEGPGLSGPTDRVFRLADDGWREVAAMPEPRAAADAAAVDGSIYVAGGVGPEGLAETMFVLDPEAGQWSTLPGPPTPREHLGVAAAGGRVYVVGGRTGGIGSNLAATEVYDPAEESWEQLADMPTARGGIRAAGTANGLVVAPGGEQQSGTYPEVEAFDVEAGRWITLPDLPTPRHGLGVVAVDTTVYAIAGGPEPGATFSGEVTALDLSGASP